MMGPYLMLGILMLLKNSYTDFKTRTIDSRYNWFAYGATLMLLVNSGITFTYLGILIVLSILAGWMFSKSMADGDTEAIRWIIFGFGVLHPAYVTVYFAVLLVLFVIIAGIARYGKMTDKKLPGYPILLGAYIITAAAALGL